MDPYLPKFWCHCVGKARMNKITLPNTLFWKCIPGQHLAEGIGCVGLGSSADAVREGISIEYFPPQIAALAE